MAAKKPAGRNATSTAKRSRALRARLTRTKPARSSRRVVPTSSGAPSPCATSEPPEPRLGARSGLVHRARHLPRGSGDRREPTTPSASRSRSSCPGEVARLTKAIRDVATAMLDDAASRPGRVRASAPSSPAPCSSSFVVLVDTANADGEMAFATFTHHDLEELDWKRSSALVYRSLSAATLAIARRIEERWVLA